ncbi:uncharacterized protein LOC129315658 [Prosopis cineraria]|uniref:uncharacterized protein LOC129315658 n=1 Tax=Prosopis cineraria TaxID=364024 RepID=UPI00240EDE0C|nr:uncharacterized protein LOC129315658 [Prosopis cineraria]
MENLFKAIDFYSGNKQHKNHPRIKTEAQHFERTRHEDNCMFSSSMLGHEASQHRQSKHHSHTRAFKRTNTPVPTTPHELKGRGEQIEGTRGTGPTPLGMSNTLSWDIRGNHQIQGLSSNTRGGPCATYHSQEDAPLDCPPACGRRYMEGRGGSLPTPLRKGPLGCDPHDFGPCDSGPSSAGPNDFGPCGSGLSGAGLNGFGPDGVGPNGSGPCGSGPSGAGPNGFGPNGTSADNFGPYGSGFSGAGPIDFSPCG